MERSSVMLNIHRLSTALRQIKRVIRNSRHFLPCSCTSGILFRTEKSQDTFKPEHPLYGCFLHNRKFYVNDITIIIWFFQFRNLPFSLWRECYCKHQLKTSSKEYIFPFYNPVIVRLFYLPRTYTIYVPAAAVFLLRFWQRLCFVRGRLPFDPCAIRGGCSLCRDKK